MKRELISLSQMIFQDQDGLITSIPGQVPIIIVSDDEPLRFISVAVNFLRCGCKAVQLAFVYQGPNIIERSQQLLESLRLTDENRITITMIESLDAVAIVKFTN